MSLPEKIEPLRFPDPIESRLENNLELVIVARRGLPLVSAQLLFEAGASADPTGQEGLATITAELLRRGTKKRTGAELDRAIEFLGGDLDVDAGPEAATLAVDMTSEHLDVGLSVLAELAQEPIFAANELKAHKRRYAAELSQTLDDLDAVAGRMTLRTLMPKGHPYARNVSGTRASVGALRRKDLVDFHARHYVPSRAVLFVVGDVDPAEVQRQVEKRLGSWRASPGPTRLVPPPASPARTKLLIVHKPFATQVQVRFACLVPLLLRDDGFFAASVASAVLGGTFTSRLVEEVRVNRGLSYHASLRLHHRRTCSYAVAKSFTKNESVGELLSVMHGEIERARTGGFTKEEVEGAARYLAGLYPLRFETNAQVAGLLAEERVYQLPRERAAQYGPRMLAVTADEASEAARSLYFAAPFAAILVGDRTAIRRGLRESGLEGEVVELPLAAVA